MLTIEYCRPDRLEEVRDFYGRYGYWHGVRNGQIIIATDGEKIIAAVRLCCDATGALTLHDFRVHKNYQKRGVGSLMLRLVDRTIGRAECWLVARLALKDFYGRIGFSLIPKVDVPAEIKDSLVAPGFFFRRPYRPRPQPPR